MEIKELDNQIVDTNIEMMETTLYKLLLRIAQEIVETETIALKAITEGKDTFVYDYKFIRSLFEGLKLEVSVKTSDLTMKMLNECRVINLTAEQFLATNKKVKGYRKTESDRIIVCPKYLLFSKSRDKIWTLESLKDIEEAKKKGNNNLDTEIEEQKELILLMDGEVVELYLLD